MTHISTTTSFSLHQRTYLPTYLPSPASTLDPLWASPKVHLQSTSLLLRPPSPSNVSSLPDAPGPPPTPTSIPTQSKSLPSLHQPGLPTDRPTTWAGLAPPRPGHAPSGAPPSAPEARRGRGLCSPPPAPAPYRHAQGSLTPGGPAVTLAQRPVGGASRGPTPPFPAPLPSAPLPLNSHSAS